MTQPNRRYDSRRIRPNVLGARLTFGEYKQCREAAQRAGLSVSEWARHELLKSAAILDAAEGSR